MNLKEYISSGVLEAYALGDQSETERLETERNLKRYPELREELRLIEESMEALFIKAGEAPPSRVKEKILAATQGASKGATVIPLTSPDSNITFWKYATAASVAIALTSAILAYNYWGNWKESENNLAELVAMNERMASDYNQVNQRMDKIEDDMKVMESPAFQRVVMKGTNNSPDAMASIYWNQQSKEVYLNIQHLPNLTQEQQYQLWAIVDGKPIDMGVFDASTSGLLKMKEMIDKPAAFAVTVEPRGGRPSPTMETMQVVGNA